MASSENGLQIYRGPSWPLAPTSSLICFYSADPLTPRGSLARPRMVRLAAGPFHAARFPIKWLYLTGPRAQGQVQTDIWWKLLLAIIPHRSSPCLHSLPHFGLLFVVVCFQQKLPLWTANGQKRAGEMRGRFRGRRGSGSSNRCQRHAARGE